MDYKAYYRSSSTIPAILFHWWNNAIRDFLNYASVTSLINPGETAAAATVEIVDDAGVRMGQILSLSLAPRSKALIADPGAFGISGSKPVTTAYLRISTTTTTSRPTSTLVATSTTTSVLPTASLATSTTTTSTTSSTLAVLQRRK